MNLGFTEILLILVLALVLFGAKKLPEVGQSFGKALREFKRGMEGIGEDNSSKADANKGSVIESKEAK